MEDKLFVQFVPAQVIEQNGNTFPDASLEDKLKIAIRRNLSNGTFAGEIKGSTPRILIRKYYFNQERMGYDVMVQEL